MLRKLTWVTVSMCSVSWEMRERTSTDTSTRSSRLHSIFSRKEAEFIFEKSTQNKWIDLFIKFNNLFLCFSERTTLLIYDDQTISRFMSTNGRRSVYLEWHSQNYEFYMLSLLIKLMLVMKNCFYWHNVLWNQIVIFFCVQLDFIYGTS